MTTSEIFLIAMLLILAIPYAIWRLGRTEHFAPLVVVQIMTGVLLGPGILGAVFPDYYKFIFNRDVVGALNGLAWWASILFVWVAGIELDIGAAWKNRGDTGVTAAFSLIIPLMTGALATIVLLSTTEGWVGAAGSVWQVVFGMGMACAVTALPILILLLEKLEVLRRPFGQRVLRYASVDDIAIWGVLAIILLDVERIGRQVGFLILFPIAAIAIRRLMARLPQADIWFVGLIWLVVCAFLSDRAGLHFMVGAFLAGAVLDAGWFDEKKLDAFRGFTLLTLMPIFFLSTGLRTDWSVGGLVVFGAAALLLAGAVLGKLAGAHLAARLLGWPRGEAGVIGWLLQTKGLIMIIFANILLDKAIITGQSFTALLLMAIASTMLTIPVVAAHPVLRAARDRGWGE